MEGFCSSLLRISMAQICQELGWHAIQSTPCELLTDILQRYIQQLATVSHQYAEQYGRTEPNIDDLGLAFRQMNVSLYELENYVRDVDPIPFKHDIPKFPLARDNDLQHPKPGSRDDRERLQYIPSYLPPIIGSDDFGEPIGHHRDSVLSASGAAMDTDSPESKLSSSTGASHNSPRGEKRDASGPLFSDQAMKRLRLDGDGTPQELTAVSINFRGELTPKREGKLPIATTPPQRLQKLTLPGSDISASKASKAITEKLLIKSEETIVDRLQPKSPKGGLRTPAPDNKSPKSKMPVTPKQKAQTKSPKHMMFSPTGPSKYPVIRPKSAGTPSAGDKPGEFSFPPPPKSPKALSSSLSKKQAEKQQESAAKQEKSIYDFEEDEFDSKPSKDPQSSPTPTGPYKEPSAFLIQDEPSKLQTATSESINASIDAVLSRSREEHNQPSPSREKPAKVKKTDKEKRKSISKDKAKIKQKLKTKKSKEDIPSYYDTVGSVDKKHSTPKIVKRKDSESGIRKTPKLVIKTSQKGSSEGELKVIKKKYKKISEKDIQKQLKVKKLKKKSIDYKNKSKATKQGVGPSATKPEDDSSPEKRKPIGKLSLIKSSGSKLQFKIARPAPEGKKPEKEKGKKPDKPKKVVSKDKGKLKIKKIKTSSSEMESSDKEKKHSGKDKKKSTMKKEGKSESSEKKSVEKTVSTPTVPKITFKLGSAPAGGDSPQIVIKKPPASPPPPPTVPKISIAVPTKKSKDSSKSSKSPASQKTVAKPKGEGKSKAEPKSKSDSRKSEPKPKAEAKPKASKKKEKDSDREKESDKEKEKPKEKGKEKAREKEKPSKAKEEPTAKVEVSPYDFDAPSPPPTTPKGKKESTHTKKEPPPGVFAPSKPPPTSPATSKPSTTGSKSSSKSAAAPKSSSPAPQKSKQKTSVPTPPPTKAALKALPPSASKGSRANKQKEK